MLSSYVSERMMSSMCEVSRDVVRRAIMECGEMYNFDSNEAIRRLGVDNMEVVKEKGVKKDVKKDVVTLFPLPYNGEMKEECCNGLKQNHGLYTQCVMMRKEDEKYCKGCKTQADKNENGEPDYGTIQSRQAVGILEYVDPKGKSPTAYTKIMKKFKLTEEQVIEEGKKMNMEINSIHFVVGDMKRGRPKSAVEKASKGVKGRPKKSKKVLELNEGNEEDLFASMVAAANKSENESLSEESENVSVMSNGSADDNGEKAAKDAVEKAAKETEKAAKETEKAAKDAEKAAKKEAEKAAKEAEKAAKEAEKAAKDAEKAAKEAEKAAKKEAEKAAKEAEKAAKSAKEAAKETAKETGKAAKEAAKEDEPEVVKRFEYEGVKYLKSKKSGVVYNMEQDIIGKWNAETNKIEFDEMESEEEEDEYEE